MAAPRVLRLADCSACPSAETWAEPKVASTVVELADPTVELMGLQKAATLVTHSAALKADSRGDWKAASMDDSLAVKTAVP
jgi:hypothetical protein